MISPTTSDSEPVSASGRLAIVVVNYGASRLVDSNLAKIDAAAIDADVIVVDNFHSAAERDAVRALAAARGWTLVAMRTNPGFGAGVNCGVQRGEADGCTSFLLLNPDAWLATESIREMWRDCETNPMAMQCPLIVRPSGAVWFRGASLDPRSGDVRSVEDENNYGWLTGACLMVHRDLWQATGGFDPAFFLYWEDVDLSRRVVEIGGQLRLRHEFVAVHEVGGTQGAAKSTGYYYYNCRNRLLFAAKHLSRRRTLRWILNTPAATMHVMSRGGGRRVLLRSPAIVSAAVRGSWAGLLIAIGALVRGPTGRSEARP